MGDIISKVAEGAGFSVVRSYCGHGTTLTTFMPCLLCVVCCVCVVCVCVCACVCACCIRAPRETLRSHTDAGVCGHHVYGCRYSQLVPHGSEYPPLQK